MVRAFVLGVMAWCVEAVLLVVAAVAIITALGPARIDGGPACPSGLDPRALGGDGTLLPKFYASEALDSRARVRACLALAQTDLPAATTGVSRIGAAAAPLLFERLLVAQGDDRKALDTLLQAALPDRFPARSDDGSEEELAAERWLRVRKVEGPDLTPHEAELAVDRLVVNPSHGREASVRRLGSVAVPALVRAMATTRDRRALAALAGLAHDATQRGPVLALTASAGDVDAAVADWTKWLDDHRWDYEPHPNDRRIPWALRETRFARLLERAWESWTASGRTRTDATTSASFGTLVTAERTLAAVVLGRTLIALAGEAAAALRLPAALVNLAGVFPALLALALRPFAANANPAFREANLLLVGAALAALTLALPAAHVARLRFDPIARLTAPTPSVVTRLSLLAVAPLTLLGIVYLESYAGLGGLGAAMTHGEWLGPASMPAFTRVALLLPFVRFAVRVVRHVADDERIERPRAPASAG